MWKQFHKIHSLIEQRKSQIKTNWKYFSGYIRHVAAARWKKLFPRLLWWSEWEWPLRLICLTIWSTVGGTFEEGLWSVALLEEVHHLGWALRFPKLIPFPLDPPVSPPPHCFSLSSCLCSRCSFQILFTIMPAWHHAPHHNGHELLLWNYKQGPNLNFSFYKLPWPWCFVIATQEQPRQSQILSDDILSIGAGWS